MEQQDEVRYSRQVRFAPIGPEGQARLRAARVLLLGCGGLGAETANLLARAGVGFLGWWTAMWSSSRTSSGRPSSTKTM